MNSFQLFLAVLAVLFLLFVVIPNLINTPITLFSKSYAPVVTQTTNTTSEQQTNHMLDAYFQPASVHVPEDFPTKLIGDCPYSKPQSKPLPLTDIPMCIAVTDQNMMLV